MFLPIKREDSIEGLSNSERQKYNSGNKPNNSPWVLAVGLQEIGFPLCKLFMEPSPQKIPLVMVIQSLSHFVKTIIWVHNLVLGELAKEPCNGLIALSRCDDLL